MSKPNVAKSRADKAGKTVSAPTPAQIHEIIPGKFNDQDWNFMLDHDDNDDFVSDIIEDVCSSALDIIYKNYIDKQLIPFTVCQAKDAIVQIVEWQFLARDEGEKDTSADPGWCEDEEPTPAEPESWAQGSVPKMIYTPRPEVIAEETEPEQEEKEQREMSQIVEETQEEVTETTHEEAPLGGIHHERTIIQDEPSLVIEGEQIEAPEEFKQPPPKEEQVVKKKKSKRHFGPLKSAGVSKMTESLEESEMKLWREEYGYQEQTPFSPSPTMLNMPASCHSIVKLQAGRPPGHRDVVYDERCNVVSLTKISPEELPNHKVPTRYAILAEDKSPRVRTRAVIVDPEVEAAQARLEAMRTGRYIAGAPRGGAAASKAQPVREPHPPASQKTHKTRSKARTSGTTYTVRTGASTRTAKTDKSTVLDGPRSPLPPPLIESMEVSAGVIVREGDRVKKGPRQRPKQEDLIATAISRGLRSIKLNPAQAALTVSQILESREPVVKPIIDQSPIPPISSQQQVQ